MPKLARKIYGPIAQWQCARFVPIYTNFEMFYIYVLQSGKHGTYYIGVTQDIKNRMALHNRGRVHSTKSKKPWKLVASKTVLTMSEAMAEEKRLKAIKKRVLLERTIKHF